MPPQCLQKMQALTSFLGFRTRASVVRRFASFPLCLSLVLTPLSVPELRRQIEVSETFPSTSQNVLPTQLATFRSFPLHVALTPYAVCALLSYHGKAFKDLRQKLLGALLRHVLSAWIMAFTTSHQLHNRDLAYAADHYPICFLTLPPLASPTMTGSGTTLPRGWRAPFAVDGS